MKKESGQRAKLVAANIRKIREMKDYTQDYLAAKLKISQNAYSKVELGYSKITLDRLYAISEILEVDPLEVLMEDMDSQLADK